MKFNFKIVICLLVIISVLLITGCVVDRDKKALNDIYSNDSNYITVTGEVVSVNKSLQQDDTIDNWSIRIEVAYTDSDGAKTQIYQIATSSDIDVSVGDTITYVTVAKTHRNYTLRIVEVIKDGETLLAFDDGKAHVLSWIDGLAYK